MRKMTEYCSKYNIRIYLYNIVIANHVSCLQFFIGIQIKLKIRLS